MIRVEIRARRWQNMSLRDKAQVQAPSRRRSRLWMGSITMMTMFDATSTATRRSLRPVSAGSAPKGAGGNRPVAGGEVCHGET